MSYRRRSYILVLSFASIASVVASPSLATAVDDARVHRILEAWRAREMSCKTAVVSWEATRTLGPGHFRPRAELLRTSKDMPDSHRYPEQGTIWFDGDKVAFHDLALQESEWTLNELRSGFNGHDSRTLYVDKPTRFPTGTVHRRRGFAEGQAFKLKAALLAFRPATFALVETSADRLGIAPAEGVIGEWRCLIVEDHNARYGYRRLYWVAAEGDHRVLRFVGETDGVETIRVDIDYQQDPAHGWLPRGWSELWINPETKLVVESASATTSSCAVDTPVPAGRFEVSFPPGTWVTDETNGTQYLQLADGAKRTITQEELRQGVTYEEIMRSSAAAGPSLHSIRNVALPASIVIAGVVLVSIRLWRRRQGYFRK